MYHAMGYSSILVMQAGMTFDPSDMELAMVALKEALRTCQKYNSTTMKLFRGREGESSLR